MNKNLKILFTFLFFAIILFIHNDKISLWDQDEAAYAAFGKEMLETGNYLIPNYTWSHIHRKTPLHFWMIAFSYKIFGINEFAVRFFSATAIMGTLIMMYFFGKKLFDKRIAYMSVLILGSSYFILLLSKMSLTDGLLLFFETLMAFSLFFIMKNKEKKYIFWFWFAMAIGLLIKGPAIALFGGFLFLLAFTFSPNRKNLIILHPWFYGWLSIIPIVVWGYLTWQQDDGEFIKWLTDWYVLKRVNSSVLGQTGPPGYYLATFIIFFLPFLVILPQTFINAFKSLKTKDKNLIPALWLLAGWLFFEFLKSKLPSYALAAHPAIAILIAIEIDNIYKKKQFNISHKIAIILQFILSLSLIVITLKLKNVILGFNFIYFQTTFAIMAIFTATLIYTIFKKKIIFFKKIIFINALLSAFLLFAICLPQIDKLKNSTKQTSEYIKQISDNQTTVVIENTFGTPPSLPFYIETIAGKKYIIETDYQSLKYKFSNSKHYIFILDKKIFSKFEKDFDIKTVRIISSLSTDRRGKQTYYIIKNY